MFEPKNKILNYSFLNLEKKIIEENHHLFYETNWINTYFCYFTGALTLGIDLQKAFVSLNLNYNFGENDLETEEEESEQKIEKKIFNDFKIIKKRHKKILNTIFNLKHHHFLLQKQPEFKEKYEKLKHKKFNFFPEEDSIIFNSFQVTFHNIAELITSFIKKIEIIFENYKLKKSLPEIIKSVYGDDFIDNDNKIKKNFLIYKIYCDQAIFEKILMILKSIVEMSKDEYYHWIGNLPLNNNFAKS